MIKRPNGVPATERLWVTIKKEDGREYYITSKINDTSMFFFYIKKDGKAVKVDKDRNPITLEKRNVKD